MAPGALMVPAPLLTAAADYLNRGLQVIALTGKTPNVAIHRRGLSEPIAGPVETTEDWELLAKVFGHPDTTGVGIVITYPYIVIDVDGEEGAEQLQAIIGGQPEGGLYPDATWVARTPRLPAGGLHLWFSSIQPTGSIKLGSKLDLKGQLSYVVAPPSLHPDGGRYEWLVPPDDDGVMEVPQAIEDRIAYHARQAERREVSHAQKRPVRQPRYAVGDTVFYAQLGFDAVIAAVTRAEEGNRNNMLHWAAATLAEEGAIEEDFLALSLAADKAGLERVEVERTIRSARRRYAGE